MHIRQSFQSFIHRFENYKDSLTFEKDLNDFLKELNPEAFSTRFQEHIFDKELLSKKEFLTSEFKRRVVRGVRNGLLLSAESARSFQQVGVYVLFTLGTEVLMMIIVAGKVIVRRLFKNEEGGYEVVRS